MRSLQSGKGNAVHDHRLADPSLAISGRRSHFAWPAPAPDASQRCGPAVADGALILSQFTSHQARVREVLDAQGDRLQVPRPGDAAGARPIPVVGGRSWPPVMA